MIDGAAWLLLVHTLPPRPPYLRAKVMRRLTRLGALPLKRSAYLLPANDGTLEDFQWLRQEIRDEGGEAWVVDARFVAGFRDDEIRDRFRAMRSNDYTELATDARAVLQRVRTQDSPSEPAALEADRRRLLRRLEAIRDIDFFEAPERAEVEALMSSIERSIATGSQKPTATPTGEALRSRTWMTRIGVKVDRIASAWLIRRFIDPAATFVFVPADQTNAVPGALRFDMFEGEFTHDGNRCTFEVLLEVSGRAGDRGLAAIAQIVHDLDLRDDLYQRSEAAGVSALINGIVSRFDDDQRRIAEGTPLFDALYASLGGTAPARTGAERP